MLQNIIIWIINRTYSVEAVNANTAIVASQGVIHKFEKVKRKILFCNSDIQFNRTCLTKKITPTYATINIAVFVLTASTE
jgi:hypothetical protein